MNHETINMTLDEAKEYAQQGVKVTHRHFSNDEYLTMQGNMIIFEDGCKIYIDDWLNGMWNVDRMLTDWSLYKTK